MRMSGREEGEEGEERKRWRGKVEVYMTWTRER